MVYKTAKVRNSLVLIKQVKKKPSSQTAFQLSYMIISIQNHVFWLLPIAFDRQL